jgi:hypothetical protein
MICDHNLVDEALEPVVRRRTSIVRFRFVVFVVTVQHRAFLNLRHTAKALKRAVFIHIHQTCLSFDSCRTLQIKFIRRSIYCAFYRISIVSMLLMFLIADSYVDCLLTTLLLGRHVH